MKGKVISAVAAALALLLVMGICAEPAQAYIESGTSVYLLGQGGTTYDDDNWRCWVDYPDYLALDQDYWNLTVCLQYINLSAAGQTYDPAFSVTVYIDDGSLNYSSTTGTITESQTADVYSNISIGSSAISLFQQNTSATMTVQLVNNSVANDTFVATIGIYTTQGVGSIDALVPGLIGLVILVVIVGFIADMGDSFGKSSRKSSGKKKSSKSKGKSKGKSKKK